MNVALSLPQPLPVSSRLRDVVIPVRYVAGGRAVQTTSGALSTDLVFVRSMDPPQAGMPVDLKLYFPDTGAVEARAAVAGHATSEPDPGFWAEFLTEEADRRRLADLLAGQGLSGNRGCQRVTTDLPVTLRDARGTSAGRITNLSRSGAFIELRTPPPRGSVLHLDLQLPGAGSLDCVDARVAHVVEPRGDARGGIGVQFTGAKDGFRLRVDEYLGRALQRAQQP
jgi:PilZ domain